MGRELFFMKISRHCPLPACPNRGTCGACKHGQQYERMASKIQRLQNEARQLKRKVSIEKGAQQHEH